MTFDCISMMSWIGINFSSASVTFDQDFLWGLLSAKGTGIVRRYYVSKLSKVDLSDSTMTWPKFSFTIYTMAINFLPKFNHQVPLNHPWHTNADLIENANKISLASQVMTEQRPNLDVAVCNVMFSTPQFTTTCLVVCWSRGSDLFKWKCSAN